MNDLVSLEEIERARAALPPIVRRTPTVPFAGDNAMIGSERLFLKLENPSSVERTNRLQKRNSASTSKAEAPKRSS